MSPPGDARKRGRSTRTASCPRLQRLRAAGGRRDPAEVVDQPSYGGGEDTLYWPVLDTAVQARGADADRAEVTAMSDEHAEIDPALAALTSAWRAMADHPCDDHRHALEIRLAGLRETLGAHLEHEETVVLPLVQRVMTEDEMAGVELAIQKGYRLRDTPFMIGWVTDGLPPAALERFFAFSGGPFKLLYAVVRRAYARREQRAFRHADLLGTAVSP
ncbi:hypothetical protein N798_07490 [Knoellia flava TL1]|uniref:Hemerythrin-like domain-containing protein n=1 Tax=Knoellia flava TL1 TaxID=1385518 RepID=A0ABR4XEH0_9MICO|nr:hypothetical protein N798_07490 [Knoellia flava TL1]